MSYTVEDLDPINPILIIDNREIEISLITLHIESLFVEHYGTLVEVFAHIKKHPTDLLKIIWHLVIDKKQFQDNYEVFKKYSLTSEAPLADVSKKMMEALNESVNKSRPKIKNMKRYKEIQEINGSTEGKKACYAVYFDGVAKRYGYSLKEFYELTLGQLHIILKVIGDESYKELEIAATLADKKMNPRIEYSDITEDEEKENEDQALEALKQLQEEYKKNNKKD